MSDLTQPVEGCSRCPHCDGFDALGDPSVRSAVRCGYDSETDGPRAPPVATVLAPFSFAARVGAVQMALERAPRGIPLVVVDETLRFMALCERGPKVRPDDGSLSLAVQETASLLATLGRLRLARKWYAPVVSSRGTFLGVVDQADVARAMCAPAEGDK